MSATPYIYGSAAKMRSADRRATWVNKDPLQGRG
jgi:hypothetical protein